MTCDIAYLQNELTYGTGDGPFYSVNDSLSHHLILSGRALGAHGRGGQPLLS